MPFNTTSTDHQRKTREILTKKLLKIEKNKHKIQPLYLDPKAFTIHVTH
jgi:hypothetical protein